MKDPFAPYIEMRYNKDSILTHLKSKDYTY